MLDRYLGQEQAATSAQADEQAVASNFNVFGANGFGARQNAELNLQMGRFFFRDRAETTVVESGRTGGFGDRAIQGAGGQNIADAAAQFAAQMQ